VQSWTYHNIKYAGNAVPYTLRDEGTYEASTEEHETSLQLQRLSRDEVDYWEI